MRIYQDMGNAALFFQSGDPLVNDTAKCELWTYRQFMRYRRLWSPRKLSGFYRHVSGTGRDYPTKLLYPTAKVGGHTYISRITPYGNIAIIMNGLKSNDFSNLNVCRVFFLQKNIDFISQPTIIMMAKALCYMSH